MSFILRKYRTSQIHTPNFLFLDFCRSLSILDELWMVLVRSWTCACAESRAKRRVLAHPASSCAAPAARAAPVGKLCLTAAASRPTPAGKLHLTVPASRPAPTLLENCFSSGPASRRGGPASKNCLSACSPVGGGAGGGAAGGGVAREEQIPRFAREQEQSKQENFES